MKPIPITIALVSLLGGIGSLQNGPEQVVILSGDTQGYLSPCGCTSPMMGGIRRRAAVIRSLTIAGHTTVLENGGFAETAGRQDQLKAETIAQTMADLGVAAINVGPADAQLGSGTLLQVAQLSNNKLVSLSVEHPENHGLGGSQSTGPFLVGGATDVPQSEAALLGDSPVTVDNAAASLVQAADDAHLKPILMLQGSHNTAVRLARKYPALALIQYSSIGDPPEGVERVGDTVLATTGEHGKHIVKLSYRNGRFEGYRSIVLGPEFKDDPVASRFYSAYLERVKSEKLFDRMPRRATAAYAGSQACMSCHRASGHVWKASQHRLAFQTIDKLQHGVDPDCVSCHVVGIGSTKGFRSLAATPQLAGVGCESCHGPALSHSLHPAKIKLPRIGEKACVGCHNPQNSPNFDFTVYWRRIAH